MMEQESTAEATSNVYQLKISLKGPKPPVWRRIQVPEHYSFFDLHVAIQDCMGWSNRHLHKFEAINHEPPADDLYGYSLRNEHNTTIRSESNAKIAKYLLSPNDKATYEYDLGASWLHDIRLEKILPATPGEKYPQCIAGRRACPPEDCTESEEDDAYDEWNEKKFDRKSVVFTDPETRLPL